MGWCREFGVTVREECGHLMRAGEAACFCPECGVVCEGQFNGCATVWAAGPREVVLVRPESLAFSTGADPPPATDGDAGPDTSGTSGSTNGQAPPRSAGSAPTEPAPKEPARPGPVHTSRPLREGQARRWEALPHSTPPSVDVQPVAAERARGQIFEWLQASFGEVKESLGEVNSQLRVLNDSVNRQQQAPAGTDVQAAAGRLSQLLDALSVRIASAVQEATTSWEQSVVAEPRRAESQPSAEPAGSRTPAAAEPRLAEPGGGSKTDDMLAGAGVSLPPASAARRPEADVPAPPRPEHARPEPVTVSLGTPRSGLPSSATPGVRSRLTRLASSSIQPRINQSGWLDKLRALNPDRR